MAMSLMATVFEWSFPVVQTVVEVTMVGVGVGVGGGGVADEEEAGGEGDVHLVATSC